MADWWDERAAKLQRAGRLSEEDKNENYTIDEANRAAVYTREDMTLAVSYLSSLNRQIYIVRAILIAILAVLIFIAARLYFEDGFGNYNIAIFKYWQSGN